MDAREGLELVLFQKVVHAHAEQLGDEADVVLVVEPVEEVDAFATGGER